jgi:hypothetical protein
MFVPFTYQLVKRFAVEILKLKGKDAEVSHSWCKRFVRRFNFASRKARHVEVGRAVAG